MIRGEVRRSLEESRAKARIVHLLSGHHIKALQHDRLLDMLLALRCLLPTFDGIIHCRDTARPSPATDLRNWGEPQITRIILPFVAVLLANNLPFA